MYINCVSLVPVSEGSKIPMYVDDILLSKLINPPDNYMMICRETLMQSECFSKCHLTLSPSKCKYLVAFRRRQPIYNVLDYSLAVMSWKRLTATAIWADHINHICSKARKLVGMLYRQFYIWVDTSTLLCIRSSAFVLL